MSTFSASSLSVTLTHAVAFLVRPLASCYDAVAIQELQAALKANLTAVYADNWDPAQPLRGTGRRCLTLSPFGLPPRAVYNACVAAQIQWADWIRALGGVEFDLFIDPGLVSFRALTGSKSKITTVWSEELEAQAQMEALKQLQRQTKLRIANTSEKTFAQMVIEQDDEDDEILFSMIAEEVRAPTWMTPLLSQFPDVPSAPQLVVPSRSSSRSSMRSSTLSSSDESIDSYGSVSSVTSLSSFGSSTKAPSKASRRERARQARVFIDTTKVDVTPYDGGKTTVLTGGVMLGAPAGKRPSHKRTITASRF